MPPKHSYWQRYDSLFKYHSKKDLFERLKEECEKLGFPYVKKDPRGRKPKYSFQEYAAFLCLQKIFNNKYREMELEVTLYLPKKVDHSTLQRNYGKLTEAFLEQLIVSFVVGEFVYWIADSTAMSSKIKVERTNEGMRRKELLTDKFHIVMGYDPPSQTTFVLGAKATDHHVSDSKGAVLILQGKQSHAYFLGDSAYNTYELHEYVKKAGLFPLMKPDKKGIKKTLSAKAKGVKLFSKNLYRHLRGVVETVFGGTTNAGLILSYARKPHTRRLDTLILALRHNLLAAMRLLQMVFMRQTQSHRVCREIIL